MSVELKASQLPLYLKHIPALTSQPWVTTYVVYGAGRQAAFLAGGIGPVALACSDAVHCPWFLDFSAWHLTAWDISQQGPNLHLK